MLFFNKIFLYLNFIVMDEKKIFKFLKDNTDKIKNNENADNVNRVIKQIINIWHDNEDIQMLLECFYYGLNNTMSLSLPISMPSDLEPIITENVNNGNLLASLADNINLQNAVYITSFKQLLLMLSHFDTNLVYKSDSKYVNFMNLNNKLLNEIDEYYNNLKNSKVGGNNMILNNGKHQKYILHNNQKLQILNTVNNGLLVSDHNNNLKVINI